MTVTRNYPRQVCVRVTNELFHTLAHVSGISGLSIPALARQVLESQMRLVSLMKSVPEVSAPQESAPVLESVTQHMNQQSQTPSGIDSKGPGCPAIAIPYPESIPVEGKLTDTCPETEGLDDQEAA